MQTEQNVKKKVVVKRNRYQPNIAVTYLEKKTISFYIFVIIIDFILAVSIYLSVK